MEANDAAGRGRGRGRGRGASAPVAPGGLEESAPTGRGRGRGRGGSTSAYSDGSIVELAQVGDDARKRQRTEEEEGLSHSSKVQRVHDDFNDPSAAEVAALMGFDSFATTKNTQVESNITTAARGARAPKQFRKARQYMNRKGGFNQPLSES